MGQGKSPWYTHRLMHRKRVTSERHDSYFRLMTIKDAIPKIERAIEWAIELFYNSVETGSQWVGDRRVRDEMWLAVGTPDGVWGPDQLVIRCSRESQQSEPLGLWLSIRRTRTTHGYVRRGWWGQYVAVFARSPVPSHTQTLQIKWEVYFS